MQVITAPEVVPFHKNFSVFLAGSIEMDVAERWQDIVIKALLEEDGIILNPRRVSWNASWKQEIGNPVFTQQVDWELDALEGANMIIMYFDINTQSPISLLELGLFARSRKLIVCCPEGFWRKGNVDVVCKRYNVPQVQNLEELISEVKERLR